MKAFLTGRNANDLRVELERAGLTIAPSPDRADVIVAYGGDGTLIGAEHEFPGVPKVGLRDDRFCVKCDVHRTDQVLARVVRGEAEESRLLKLETKIGTQTLTGMNDVLVRNADMRSAVRFTVIVNGAAVTDEIIGDGVVLSTPFGSTAYFRSITNTSFRTGIGVAFNNCTDFDNHLVLNEEDVIGVHVIRGPADMTADNHPDLVRIQTGELLSVRRSKSVAVVLALDTMRCGQCRYKNAPRRRF